MEAVIFFVCAAAVLTGAFGVVIARNPVHSALFLLQTLLGVAVLFLQLNAALVAAIQIVVYASAIVVLFLFVITLLGVDRHEPLADPHRFQRPAAIVIGVLVPVQLIVLAGRHWTTGVHSARAPLDQPPSGNVEVLAKALFTDYIWAFEMTAVLLVIAVVGGVVLARRSGQRATGVASREATGVIGPALAVDVPPNITATYYLVLASILFTIGAVGLLVRRNTLVMFMCIELMLNASNLTFVAYAKALNDISGQVIVFFTLVVAAAEVAVGLAIIVAIFRRRQDVTADDVDLLKG